MGSIVSARTLPISSAIGGGLDTLCGRFVEITGSYATAALSVAAGLLHAAQQRDGYAVWIGGEDSVFFPPDFSSAGIDMRVLPVLRLPNAMTAWRAADTLLRSGAFAVVVVDARNFSMPSLSMQTRLTGLAQKHGAVLVALCRESRGETVHSSWYPFGSIPPSIARDTIALSVICAL
jgi:hypothetical protein